MLSSRVNCLVVPLLALLLAVGCGRTPAPVPPAPEATAPGDDAPEPEQDAPDKQPAVVRPASREPVVNVAAGQTVQGAIRAHLGRRNSSVGTVAFTPDGRSLVTSGPHHALTVWGLRTGEVSGELPAGQPFGSGHSMNISLDGRTLVSSGPSGTLLIWNLPKKAVQHRVAVEEGVERTALTADGTTAYVLTRKRVQRHYVATGERKATSDKLYDWIIRGTLAVTPDGQTVVVGGEKGEVILLDGKTLEEKKRLPGHHRTVASLAVSPDGKTLASVADDDEQVKLYDLEKQAETRTIPCKEGELTSVAFSPSGKLLAVSGRQSIVLIDVASGREHTRLAGPDGGTSKAVFSPDGSLLAGAGSPDGGVVLWELSAGLESRSVPCSERAECIAFTARGARAVLRGEKSLDILSLAEGKVERSLPVERYFPPAAFSLDGEVLAYCPDEEKVRIVEAGTGKERLTISTKHGRCNDVNGLMFSRDGGRLYLHSSRYQVQVWELTSPPKLQATFSESGRPIYTWVISPDGNRLALGIDNSLHLCDARSGQRLWVALAQEGPVTSVAFSPDGKQLLTASSYGYDRSARLWSVADGKLLGVIPHGTDRPTALFAPDGKTVVTINEENVFRAYDAATGKRIGQRQGGKPPRRSFLRSPDGQGVLIASEKEFHQVETAALKREAFGDRSDIGRHGPPPEPQTAIAPQRVPSGKSPEFRENWAFGAFGAFTPDGKRVVVASPKPEFLVCAMPNVEPERSFSLRLPYVWQIALFPDGKRMAVGCGDGTIRVIDLDARKEEKVLKAHASNPRYLAVSPDGKWLASGTTGSGETTVFLWDVSVGKVVNELVRGGAQLDGLAFAADSQQLLVAQSGLRRFRFPGGAELPTLKPPENISALATSPDGKLLAAAEGPSSHTLGRVHVWDSAGAPLHTLATSADKIDQLAFGPDGLLAVGFSKGTQFWDAARGKKIAEFRDYLIALSPDGKTFVTPKLHFLDISSLGDGRFHSALAPVRALMAEFRRHGEVLRVELQTLGPDTITALSSLVKLPESFALKLKDAEWINDEAVKALSGLKTMRRFEAGGAWLRDEHLQSLAVLPQLEALDLSGCPKLTSKGLTALASATRLKELALDNTSLDSAALKALSPLKELRSLRFRSTRVNDEGLVVLAEFPALAELSLGGWQVTEEGLAKLKALKALRRLSLQGASLEGEGAAAVGALTDLEELDLKGAQFDDASLSRLKGLTKLRRLDLSNTNVTDDGLKHLAGLTKLTFLGLDSTEKLTGTGLAHLSKASGLTALKLDNSGVTDAGLTGLKGWAHLRELTLPNRVTDAGLLHLTDLTSLESINLAQLKNVKGPGLAGLRNARGLTELDLSQREMTDADLEGLKGWKHLLILRLPKTITDAGLARLTGLAELRVFDVEGAKGVTDAGLKHLGGMGKLEWLDLSGTKVSDKGLPDLEVMKSLRWLRLQSTGVSEEAREKFRKKRPEVEVPQF